MAKLHKPKDPANKSSKRQGKPWPLVASPLPPKQDGPANEPASQPASRSRPVPSRPPCAAQRLALKWEVKSRAGGSALIRPVLNNDKTGLEGEGKTGLVLSPPQTEPSCEGEVRCCPCLPRRDDACMLLTSLRLNLHTRWPVPHHFLLSSWSGSSH